MKKPAAYLLWGSLGLGVIGLVACIAEHVRPDVDAGPPAANACDGGGPGNLPAPNCAQSDNTCPNGPTSSCPTCGQCMIDKAKCGDPATCLPLADNSSKAMYDFRLRKLFITAPPALSSLGTGSLIQTTVIDKGVDLAAPECGDPSGNGAFNWLLRVDPNAQTVLTGGAPPSADPFGTGFCFYRHSLGGLDIEPSTVGASFDGGTFSTAVIPLLNVPVFLSADAGAANPANVIILPLRNAVLEQTAITNNNNCIGSFNLLALDNTCNVNDPSSCSKWLTAGSLGAYMTLEEADSVVVSILSRTLCVILTLSPGGMNDAGITTCARDMNGKITAQGDYCSTTNSAGGCMDSYWLSATFAASAVTINDGSSDPTCQGSGDGGTEAGMDAAADATDAAGD